MASCLGSFQQAEAFAPAPKVQTSSSASISQEELEVYLECIADVESLGDIIEMCADVGVVAPNGATLEQLQELDYL